MRDMTAEFKERIQSAAGELREQLKTAEEEYISVLGTDEQKFARVEVDRIQKAILEAEEDELYEVLPKPLRPCVRRASARLACATMTCN